MSDRNDDIDDRSTTDDREGSVDFNYYVPPSEGGTGSMQPVHVSEPISGGSVVSWAELLRQRRQSPSSEEVTLGSLAELNVDAVSDKEILRRLEREARDMASGGSGILVKNTGQPRESGIRKKAALLPPQDDESTPHPSAEIQLPPRDQDHAGESTVNLLTAARTATKALSEDDSANVDEEDALSSALNADDGSSAINLGLEPCVASLLSSVAHMRELQRIEAAPAGPGSPIVATPAVFAPKQSRTAMAWVGGAALGIVVAIGVAGFAWYANVLPPSPQAQASIQPRSNAVAGQPVPSAPDPRIADLTARHDALEAMVKIAANRLNVSEPAKLPDAIDQLRTARERADEESKKLERQLSSAETRLREAETAWKEMQKSANLRIADLDGKRAQAEDRETQIRKEVVEATKQRLAAEERLKSETAALQNQVESLRGQLQRVRTADALLDVWPALFENPTPAIVAAAERDADEIMIDGNVSATSRAKAVAVKGFALAAQEKYDLARKCIFDASSDPAFPKQGPWAERLDKTATELTDVDATVEQIRKWLVKGESRRAAAAAERALKIFQGDRYAAAHRQLVFLRNEARKDESPSSAALEQAEQHFASGLRHFFGGRYAEAAAEFNVAIQHHRQDSRFFYFLGLAHWSLGETESATREVRTAVELEQRAKPGTMVPSRLFERVQGPARQWLDEQRK